MTQQEFLTTFWDLLNKDCAKSNFSSLSRTLMDREAEVLGKHLWEFFNAKLGMEIDKTWLTKALLRTKNKFHSCQEQAAAIMVLREVEKPK